MGSIVSGDSRMTLATATLVRPFWPGLEFEKLGTG